MKRTLLSSVCILALFCGFSQTTFNKEFRLKLSGHWDNPAIWEYKYGATWVQATRPPNGNDSVVLLVASIGAEVWSSTTVPKLIVEKNSILYVSGGAFTLWGRGNNIEGDVVLRKTGEIKYKMNAHLEYLTITNTGRFFWTGGKLYTTVVNYGVSYFQTPDPKTLYAMFINRSKLEVKDCIYTAANPSAYVQNSGSRSWLNYTNSTVNSVPGTVETQNIDGGLLTFNFNNKIDKLYNTGTIDGVGKVQLHSVRNSGYISPGWPFVKSIQFPGPMEFISQNAPTGTFDLYLDGADGAYLDSYISNHSINLSDIRLTISQVRPIPEHADTIILARSGTVSGDFLAVTMPPGFSLIKGSNFVLAKYSGTAPFSAPGAAKIVEGRSENKLIIPSILKRSQTLRIQGLNTPADAVTIVDVNGKQVFSERNYGNNVSLNKLSPGIHFYRITTREGKILTGKIIVTD